MGFLEIRYHWFAAAVVLAICLPNYALANCEAILSLSKVKSITISSKDRFQRRLDNYCKEQRNSSGRSASGGISIGGIGLSGAGGSSNQSYEQYCQENQNADAAEEAYKQYVESISPRAYDAYEQCLKSTDVDFDLTAQSETADVAGVLSLVDQCE